VFVAIVVREISNAYSSDDKLHEQRLLLSMYANTVAELAA